MVDSQLQLLHVSLEHVPNPHICLLQMGWEKCRPGYSFTNYRDLYIIHFISSGEGKLSVHGNTYSLKANDVFLIRPKERAVYTASMDDPWHYYYFAFNGAMAPELIQRTAFRDGGNCLAMKDKKLADMIQEAIAGMKSSRAADLYGLQQLFRILALIVDFDGLSEPHVSNAQRYVAQAQTHIQIHYAQPLRVADIARMLNIDRSHLYRVFHICTGISPEEYIIDFRLQEAKKLLAGTEYPIRYIAQSVGFSSYSTFFTNFVRYNSYSPTEYRRIQNYMDAIEESGFVQSSVLMKDPPDSVS